jgi:amino acid transporter
MADEEEIDAGEALTLIIVGVIGVALLIFVAILAPSLNSETIDSWGFEEWGTIAIIFLIVGALILAVFLGSDDEGEQGGVFTGYGFALTIGFLILGIVALQTNYFGLGSNDPILIDIDGDGSGDIYSDQIPDDYVDYGSPQPYGYGNYGPPNEGLLTGGQGAGVGCAAGAGVGIWLGVLDGPLPFGEIAGAAIGCAVGAATGFGVSNADFDGDPTTGL